MAQSTAGLRRLQSSMKNLRRESGFDRIAASASNASRSVSTFGKEVSGTFSSLLRMGTRLSLVFGGAGAGLLGIVGGAANAGDRAAKTASRAGVSTTAWQEMAYAASLSDVNQEQLQKNFTRLNTVTRQAAKRGTPQYDLFKSAGIDVLNASGNLKSLDDVLMNVADSVERLQRNGGDAQGLLTKIFGEEQGAKLMPLLKGGSASLREMRLEAHALGQVLAEGFTKEAEAYNDSLTKAKAGLRGIGYTFGAEFMPHVKQVVDKFTEWTKLNRTAIGETARRMAERFAKALPAIGRAALAIAKGFAKAFEVADRFATAVGGWENVFGGLAVLMGSKMVVSAYALVSAFGSLGAAFAASPIGLIIAGLAGVYALGKKIDELAYGDVKKNAPKVSSLYTGLDGGSLTSFDDAGNDWFSNREGREAKIAAARSASLAKAKEAAALAGQTAAGFARTIDERRTTTETISKQNINMTVTTQPGTHAAVSGDTRGVTLVNSYGPADLGTGGTGRF
ncbi:phage tail tape measure protein [Desulfovibrio sp. OttesenSCG-928-C06]|nr:phage tail tape measure protein [Desulfovibrio sp. OttesenSCG-928-C06]